MEFGSKTGEGLRPTVLPDVTVEILKNNSITIWHKSGWCCMRQNQLGQHLEAVDIGLFTIIAPLLAHVACFLTQLNLWNLQWLKAQTNIIIQNIYDSMSTSRDRIMILEWSINIYICYNIRGNILAVLYGKLGNTLIYPPNTNSRPALSQESNGGQHRLIRVNICFMRKSERTPYFSSACLCFDCQPTG